MNGQSKKKVRWCLNEVQIPGINYKAYESETAFQIYCATWLRKQGVRFHHSANERTGGLSGLAAKLKGQSKGFPDLILFGQPMLAIELKVLGQASPEQLAWLKFLTSIGWQCHIVRTFEQFMGVVKPWLANQR